MRRPRARERWVSYEVTWSLPFLQGLAALRRIGRPHPCHFCNKVFPFKSILRNHLRIHTGEKPFACRVCGRTFNHCSNYYKHERSCALKLAECAEDQGSGSVSVPFGEGMGGSRIGGSGGELWGDSAPGNSLPTMGQLMQQPHAVSRPNTSAISSLSTTTSSSQPPSPLPSTFSPPAAQSQSGSHSQPHQ